MKTNSKNRTPRPNTISRCYLALQLRALRRFVRATKNDPSFTAYLQALRHVAKQLR
jgi:hypothetical protein